MREALWDYECGFLVLICDYCLRGTACALTEWQVGYRPVCTRCMKMVISDIMAPSML